jgi:hypothetical protein
MYSGHVIPSEIPNTGEMERVDTKFPTEEEPRGLAQNSQVRKN